MTYSESFLVGQRLLNCSKPLLTPQRPGLVSDALIMLNKYSLGTVYLWATVHFVNKIVFQDVLST